MIPTPCSSAWTNPLLLPPAASPAAGLGSLSVRLSGICLCPPSDLLTSLDILVVLSSVESVGLFYEGPSATPLCGAPLTHSLCCLGVPLSARCSVRSGPCLCRSAVNPAEWIFVPHILVVNRKSLIQVFLKRLFLFLLVLLALLSPLNRWSGRRAVEFSVERPVLLLVASVSPDSNSSFMAQQKLWVCAPPPWAQPGHCGWRWAGTWTGLPPRCPSGLRASAAAARCVWLCGWLRGRGKLVLPFSRGQTWFALNVFLSC